MRKLNVLVLAGLLLLVPLQTGGQTKPNKEQLQEIQKALDDVKDALKTGDAKKIKEAKDKAIQLTDKYFKIPSDNLASEPAYNPSETAEGSTGRSEKDKKKVNVSIGEKAFSWSPDGWSPAALASVKIHEIVGHGGQAAAGNWYTDGKGTAIQEVEAYDVELKHAEAIGLSKKEIDEIKKRRQQWYDELNKANQDKVDKGDYKMAFLPPGDRSTGSLEGRAQVFVSGEVYADEAVVVTVRGPRTLEGTVISTEAGGNTASTKTDARGHATVPLSKIANGATTATTVIVRVLDSTGKEVARAQTKVLPGTTPDIVSRPTIPQLPSHIRQGDVITVKGENLGPQSEMIVGEQVQETSAASAKEITSFIDVPKTGTASAWVRNPYGESKSFQTNVYTFTLAAPRTTIRRGESMTATAQYESLPVGTEVHFKNTTPGNIKMDIAGARTIGDVAVVTLTTTKGSIPVNLTGLSNGGFVIEYEVRPAGRQ